MEYYQSLNFPGVISCSAVSNAYLTGKPQVSIPCAGEVFLGRSEEDEVGFTFPAKLMHDLVSWFRRYKANVSLSTSKVYVV